MHAIRMWNLAIAAALCCSPMLAQAPGGGAGGGMAQQSPQSQSPNMQQQQADQQQAGSPMNAGPAMDKAFVKKALEGSIDEVEMGKLALEKSSDDQVKQFAQKVVDDHGKMADALKPAAQQMGIKVPDGPSKGQMKKMDKMKALQGDAFDQAYIKDMVKDHKSDENEFKQEAQNTQNPSMKQFATQGSQVIEQHLQQIQQIAQSKGTTQKARM